MIFKEAINNAAKYSEANKLRVQLDMKSGELNITITDDGKGFDIDELDDRDDGRGVNNIKTKGQTKRRTRVSLFWP